MSNRGGKRENAGRPRGQGKFGEPTVAMRIPESQTATIKDFLEALQRKRANVARVNAVPEVDEFFIPEISDQPTLLLLFATKVAAGFPSPADDHIEKWLRRLSSLSELKIYRPYPFLLRIVRIFRVENTEFTY